MTETMEARETTKAIRRALKDAFPNTKFSVRRSRGTGYGWIMVDWTDGPTAAQVESVAAAFKGFEFHCSGLNYHHSVSPERLAETIKRVEFNEAEGEYFIDRGWDALPFVVHGFSADPEMVARCYCLDTAAS